jgi:hypothetical protein
MTRVGVLDPPAIVLRLPPVLRPLPPSLPL